MISRFLKSIVVREFAIIGGVVIGYLLLAYFMPRAKYSWFLVYFVLGFAILKVVYIVIYTYNRIARAVCICHTFYELFISLGMVIFVIVLSFAFDYTCLSDCLPMAFKGIDQHSKIYHMLFEFIYFSVVTFATIGYGDISPLAYSAKFLVILEITMSFFMVVFIFSNIEHIKRLSIHNITQKERTEK